MENNKNKKSVKFQGDMLNFCDFIQVFVFTRNHHLKSVLLRKFQSEKYIANLNNTFTKFVQTFKLLPVRCLYSFLDFHNLYVFVYQIVLFRH